MSTPPRIVLVTGAAAGIGLATARAFAAAGDIVVLTDLSATAAEARAAELGEGHVGLAMDVADEAAVVECMAAVAARFGRIDVLVNNAGIIDPDAGKVLDKPIEEIRRLIAVNLDGSYLVAREAGRVMLAQRSGSIVNLSSGVALAAMPGRTPYSMTKAAILGLTRALACEWAGGGVRVNAVLPGYVRTEILASLERAGKFDPRRAGTAVPLGRLAEPGEIAAAILHVAGARYVTGAAFLADGGYAAFGGRGPAAAAPVSGLVPEGAVLVTGGAAGIGAAVADHFVGLGAKVVVMDRDAFDLTNAAAVEAAVGRVGPISVLVNVVQPGVADCRRAFDTEVTGALIVSRAAARAMISAGGGGAIVNVLSSTETIRAAMTMLTKSLACEWAEHGIRVNAVAPGYIDAGAGDPEALRRRIPMGRFGEPAEIAEAVAFLASDAASYVTGMTYAVDGGCGAFTA